MPGASNSRSLRQNVRAGSSLPTQQQGLPASSEAVGGRKLGAVATLAADPEFVWSCHDAIECTSVCPSAVDLAGSILRLRRRLVGRRTRLLFGRG
jgi:Fe-S oxidoreductase